MTPEDFMAAAIEAGLVTKSEPAAPEYVNKADFETAMTSIGAQIAAAIASIPEMVAKAIPANRGGEGTKQTTGEAEVTFDENPDEFLSRKAAKGEEFTAVEQRIITEQFKYVLGQGLAD